MKNNWAHFCCKGASWIWKQIWKRDNLFLKEGGRRPLFTLQSAGDYFSSSSVTFHPFCHTEHKVLEKRISQRQNRILTMRWNLQRCHDAMQRENATTITSLFSKNHWIKRKKEKHAINVSNISRIMKAKKKCHS